MTSSRNKWLLFLAILAAQTSGCMMSAHRKQFGTVENPRFAISAPFEAESNIPIQIAGYRFNENGVFPRIKHFNQELNDLEKQCSDLEEKINTQNAQEIYGQVRNIYSKEKEEELMRNAICLSKEAESIESEGRLAAFKGSLKNWDLDVETVSQDIFTALTGQPFPPSIEVIKKEELEIEDILGYHNFFEDKVVYKREIMIRKLLTLFHEYGHVIAQHQEERFPLIFKDTRVLEEACAYAFTHAAIHKLAEYEEFKSITPFCKREYDSHLIRIAQNFYHGKDEKYHHGEGAAYVIAALQVMDASPFEVFNYLSSIKNSDLSNIDSEIKTRVKENSEAIILSHKRDLPQAMKDLQTAYLRITQFCFEAGAKLTRNDWTQHFKRSGYNERRIKTELEIKHDNILD